MTFDDFDELVRAATRGPKLPDGHEPYRYQRRIATTGLPDLLTVPTGAGKTLAVVLPWLFRRRFHPDPTVRVATPHWLVLTLPMRTLVEQAHEVTADWLTRLGLADEISVQLLMGGEDRRDARWRREPERDAIVVGTLDMVLSRTLNRGYGESRWAWPIDFGLFNNGCHFVFDEIQLMGPGLPTSLQLEGLRRTLGTGLSCASTWMSATVNRDDLSTVDLPNLDSVVELDAEDRSGPLAERLSAPKRVEALGVEGQDYARELAESLGARHVPGTRTIAVLNTVRRATDVYLRLRSLLPEVEVVLLHSRFRPGDRATALQRALARVDAGGPGRIVVSTQVLEAGVDISSRTLLTEAAPWPAIVQRAGRCNRFGEADEATLLWVPPPAARPYEQGDLDASIAALTALEQRIVTPETIGREPVVTKPVLHPVLRRRDLLELFDTAPDLGGDDVDVARFIRAGNDVDLYVAWRDMPTSGLALEDQPVPTRDERCPVPVGDARDFLTKRAARDRRLFRFDHIQEEWVRCLPSDLRPGMVLLTDLATGGYRRDTGWSPSSETAVDAEGEGGAPLNLTEGDQATGDDVLTWAPGRWVSLLRHLEEAERATRDLLQAWNPSGLTTAMVDAAIIAARLHDLGKAHPAFVEMLRKSAGDDQAERAAAEATGPPWAKSSRRHRARNQRRHFRHELVSILALLEHPEAVLRGVAEPELVLFLIAAHHGRVRVGARSLPDEDGSVLGVEDGDQLDAVELPEATLPPTTLHLGHLQLGAVDGRPSWSRRVLELRDRHDLGPFRLAFLEAAVRLADWRVSAAEGETAP